ncbi:COG4223 family protein [Caulobacter sp. DWR1-3-2b1]|uniref:COG4223 family protein n=1 Tax=Caulobacter sp. DWR1-3-2b1 TaxID=2804670 RepID=UPI003CF4A297
MNVAPDPAEIVTPSDPALYARRRPLLGPSFWAMIALCVFCVILGALVTRFGPTWFPVKSAREGQVQATPNTTPPSARLPIGSPLPVEAGAPPLASSAVEIQRLEARLGALEAGQKGVLDAATASLAAASLAEAAQTSGPFDEELASLERVLPMSPGLRALSRLAQTGAPTRSGLAAEFESLAGRAATAARNPGEDADLLARVRYALSSIVSIRQVGSTGGTTPDAKLALAQRLLDEGDVESAIRALDAIPDPARVVLASWLASAERRVEVDRHVAAIRADALASLAQVSRAVP